MIVNDYNKVPVTFQYKNSYYRAIEDGAGFSKGDIICRTQQIDESTLAPTGVESWANVDTNAAIAVAPTVGTEIEALDSKRIKLESETLAVTDAAQGLQSIPANANHAEVHVLDNDVVFTLDGATAPVANPNALGVRQANCQVFELEGVDEINNFDVMNLNAGANARLYVEYSCQFDFND